MCGGREGDVSMCGGMEVMCKCVGVGNVIWKVRGKYGRVT